MGLGVGVALPARSVARGGNVRASEEDAMARWVKVAAAQMGPINGRPQYDGLVTEPVRKTS
jgi:hypothetical protein